MGRAHGEQDEDAPEESERATNHDAKGEALSAGGGEVQPPEEIDLVAALGASIELSPQELKLYIPNKDRHSNEFGCQRKWVLEASSSLAKIGGGVTMLPAAEGGWYDQDNDTIV